jgi:putative chitinase
MLQPQIELGSGYTLTREPQQKSCGRPLSRSDVKDTLNQCTFDPQSIAKLRRMCSDVPNVSGLPSHAVVAKVADLVDRGVLHLVKTGLVQSPISAGQLAKLFPKANDGYLQQVAAELNTDLKKYGLDNRLRKAHFFAQVREESGASLQSTVESLAYSPQALQAQFRYFRQHKDEATTDGYARDPKTGKITRAADQPTIANNAYGGRNGNGDASTGDGWNFRGRGLIQVTGRANYKFTTTQYGILYPNEPVDFENSPDLLADFPYSLRSAVCFWIGNGLHELADRGGTNQDIDRITNVINSATPSKQSRRDNFQKAFIVFT